MSQDLHFKLPQFDIPDYGEPIILLHTLSTPVAAKGPILTWMVDEKPARRIRYGLLVSIRTKQGDSGTGLVSAVVEMRRHWITWMVSSGAAKCHVQIPVPWCSLSAIEVVAHEKHYRDLFRTPRAHRDDPARALPSVSTLYPYKHHITPEERGLLEERLARITRRHHQWAR